MSGTITPSFSASIVNGTFRNSLSQSGVAIVQSAIGRGGYTQTIGTTEEVIDFGDVATNGYLFIKNVDPTNYVTFGPESTGAMVVVGKLKPGEWAWFRVAPTVVMRAKADTADVKLDVSLYED